MPDALALVLTILVSLIVIVVFATAIIWSVGDIIHWVSANLPRFQALYTRTTQWLEEHGIFINEAAGLYNSRAFVGFLQEIALRLNAFAGFCLVVFLLLTFGLTELRFFGRRFDELEPKIGWKISTTSADIAQKIRKYMIIRTLASVLTGLAVFVYTYYMGLDLAIAWGIISFVLNYIPYFGTLIAIVLPVLFSTVQFESWQTAGDPVWRSLLHPVPDRELHRTNRGEQGFCRFTFRDADCILLLGVCVGTSRRLHRAAHDDCIPDDLPAGPVAPVGGTAAL